MTAIAVKVCGGTVQIDPADLDDIEAAVAAFLSAAGVEAESAAPFARSAAGVIDSFQYELCNECGLDLDMHEIAPGPFGEARTWCLKCPCCGHLSASAAEAIEHDAKWKVVREADAAYFGCFDSEPAASAFIGTLPGHLDGLYGIDAPRVNVKRKGDLHA